MAAAEQQRSPYLITSQTTLAQPVDTLVPVVDGPFTPEEATYVSTREAEITTTAAREAAVARRVTESLDLDSFRAFGQLAQIAAHEPIQITGAQPAGNVQASR